MKKRLLSLALCLALCLGLLPVGVLAEEIEPSEDAEYVASVTLTDSTSPENYTTLQAALEAIEYKRDSVTITLLKDVVATEPLVLGNFYCNSLTLDLDGHTLSGTLSDALFSIYPSGGQNKPFSIRNGTIQNSGNASAIELNYGNLTLENANVKSTGTNALVSYGNTQLYVTSGCTFQGKVSIAGDATLSGGVYENGIYSSQYSDLLASGYIFEIRNQDNNYEYVTPTQLPSYSEQPFRVVACTHKIGNSSTFTDSTCTLCGVTCQHEHYTNGKCDVCGTECKHRGRDYDTWYCNDCETQLEAMLTYPNGISTYKASLWDAFDTAPSGSTIKMLIDVTREDAWEASNCSGITLDLNGNTLTLQNGFTLSDGEFFIQDTSAETTGKINGPVSASGGTLCISGGTFSSLSAPQDSSICDLLKTGCAFQNDNGDYIIYSNATANTITNVKVVHCTSAVDSNQDNLCDYCNLPFIASVTKDGVSRNYSDLNDALANAEGGTVTVLSNVTVTEMLCTGSNCTLDLNGHKITGNLSDSLLCIYHVITIRDSSETKSGEMENTYYGRYVFNLQKGTLTIQRGTFQATGSSGEIFIFGSGKVNIEGGVFKSQCSIYDPHCISGGTFSYLYTNCLIADLLKDGYGFKNQDGNWLSDTQLRSMSVSDVTVGNAPLRGITVTADKDTYSYGETITLTATVPNANSNTTYQWYKVNNGNFYPTEIIDSATSPTYAFSDLTPSTEIPYNYYCAITYNGYTTGKSVQFTVTKADLSNATVTITNPEQLVFQPNPGSSNQSTGIDIDCKYNIKVTLPNGNEVPSYSYTVTGNVASSAGKHTLTIQGQDSCYTGSKSIEWTLLPFKLTKPALLSIIKDYDSTTDLPELALHEFYHNDPSAGSLITLNQGTDFTVDGKFDSTEVGYRTATLTFHLLNQNYTFADGSNTLVYEASSTNSASIRILEATPVGAPTLSKSALTYGETLSAITLSGSMKNKANNEPVEGTFTWQTPDEKPGVAEKHVAIWIFTPKDTTHYKTVAGEVTIPVNKATPTGEPKYTAITTSGKTLKDAGLTVNESWPEGSIYWVDANGTEMDVDTAVSANTAYTWKFVPTDTDNYNDLTGTITLWHKSSSGSSSGSVTPGTKTDTVKNPDGSTTKTETKADGSKTETTTASSGGGSTGTTVTKTDAKGNTTTEASAKLSDRDVKEAQEKGEAVSVPVKGIAAAKDANAATKIKIDVPNNANKTTVEIPVENVTSGTVAVIVHEDGTEEIVKDSIPTERGVQLELSGSTTVKIIDNSKTFDDTKDHWSRDEVNFVAARELFNGVGGNQFGVSQPMTRGMVNTVLARLADVDTTPGQGQAWYEVGTDWAKKNGISDGTNPTAPVTREQLATLLYRYAGSPSVSGTLHAADAASVSDYAEDALLWANQNGIVNGVGSNTIAPKDNAQRAQVAAMLARYLQNQ